MELIDKDALVAEIERLAEVKPIDEFQPQVQNKIDWLSGKLFAINSLRVFLDTLEVKEVDLPTWEPICSFQYFSDNDIFIEDNCLRWGNMVISLDELKKLPKKS